MNKLTTILKEYVNRRENFSKQAQQNASGEGVLVLNRQGLDFIRMTNEMAERVDAELHLGSNIEAYEALHEIVGVRLNDLRNRAQHGKV